MGEGKTLACFTDHHRRSLRVELGFGAHLSPANELAKVSFEGNQIAEISLSSYVRDASSIPSRYLPVLATQEN